MPPLDRDALTVPTNAQTNANQGHSRKCLFHAAQCHVHLLTSPGYGILDVPTVVTESSLQFILYLLRPLFAANTNVYIPAFHGRAETTVEEWSVRMSTTGHP